jgi:hypothetical protein
LVRDISKPGGTKKRFIATANRLTAGLLLPALLSGCMSSGLDVAGLSPSADKTLTTNAIQTKGRVQPETDETTISKAVSVADLTKKGPIEIPWANTTTGSAGVIRVITEENNGSYVCRNFTTSRHSYRGISNFDGRTCLVGSGGWKVINFKEVG